MINEYKEITPEQLKQIKEAWSIENREAHKTNISSVIYIGSKINGYLDNDKTKGNLIYDYYRDAAGTYWFQNRAMLPDGSIVSMEVYLFGREIKGNYWRRK